MNDSQKEGLLIGYWGLSGLLIQTRIILAGLCQKCNQILPNMQFGCSFS